ncbi:hypothetical protein BTVI_130723 [Pitangus sulphuratus]|nr:hypothetical protein BTVI_130723 [Pitangus sulphuratus]
MLDPTQQAPPLPSCPGTWGEIGHTKHFLADIFDCNFESPCELEYSFTSKDQETSSNAWVRLSGEEISQLNIPDGPERDHSESTPKAENKRKRCDKQKGVILHTISGNNPCVQDLGSLFGQKPKDGFCLWYKKKDRVSKESQEA